LTPSKPTISRPPKELVALCHYTLAITLLLNEGLAENILIELCIHDTALVMALKEYELHCSINNLIAEADVPCGNAKS